MGDGIRDACDDPIATVSTEFFPRRRTTPAGVAPDDCWGRVRTEHRGKVDVLVVVGGSLDAEGRSRDWRQDRLLGGLDAGRFVPTAGTCPGVAWTTKGALSGALCRRAVTSFDLRALGAKTGTRRVACTTGGVF